MQTIRGGFSESEGFAVALVGIVREHPTKRCLLYLTVIIFLFYCFLYAPRISVVYCRRAPARARTWNNARADMHNVVVKAFYIEPRKKKKRSLFANSGKAPLKSYGEKLSVRRLHTRPHPIAARAIRSDGSLNESAYNGDRKFGFDSLPRRSL